MPSQHLKRFLEDEMAFYDALAENESAADVMGDEQLRVIAHELLSSLKCNVTVDWEHRENARAKMRVMAKRILRKHGYVGGYGACRNRDLDGDSDSRMKRYYYFFIAFSIF